MQLHVCLHVSLFTWFFMIPVYMAYAVVGVSTGTFGLGVVIGMSGGVGSVGGAVFGVGTSNGGVTGTDEWVVNNIKVLFNYCQR